MCHYCVAVGEQCRVSPTRPYKTCSGSIWGEDVRDGLTPVKFPECHCSTVDHTRVRPEVGRWVGVSSQHRGCRTGTSGTRQGQ